MYMNNSEKILIYGMNVQFYIFFSHPLSPLSSADHVCFLEDDLLICVQSNLAQIHIDMPCNVFRIRS